MSPKKNQIENKPLFITFEGIEGSGKTTQIKHLYNFITRNLNRKVQRTPEPGGTPLADEIRATLLSIDSKTTPEMELFLYEIARRDHVQEVIRPALERGDIVLCDRFTDA